ncbi:MAG: hypothetical protein AB1716_04140 [Planctomycetota bacterium]
MRAEPTLKRAVAFFDGQNLFHAAREAFGYTYPNYDVRALAEHVCRARNWQLCGIRFYTGVPDARDDPAWSQFWSGKLAVMGRQRVVVYSRALRYRNKRVRLATSGARDAAREAAVKIVLIDGEQLAEMMIDYGVGVADARAYTVKKIDSDCFEEN